MFYLILTAALTTFRIIVERTRNKVDDAIFGALDQALLAFQGHIGKPAAFAYLLAVIAAARQAAEYTRATGANKLALEIEVMVLAIERMVGEPVFKKQLETSDVDPEKQWTDVPVENQI